MPLWWSDWDHPDGPLLTALAWVPASVERAVAQFRHDRAVHSQVAADVLDVQLLLVRALLAVYAEHSPADGRPMEERAHNPDGDARTHAGPAAEDNDDAVLFVARAPRRAQGRPALYDTRLQYNIREKVLVLFDGAARKTCSGSSVVIVIGADVYRFSYRHPVRRPAASAERIGFILSVLALSILRRYLHGSEHAIADDATIAWIGDNETLMRQVGIAGTPAYRSKEDVTRKVTAWLRERIPPRDGVYHVLREYNWLPDTEVNGALDAWTETRSQVVACSCAFGNTQSLIDEVEVTWKGVCQDHTHVDATAVEADHEQEATRADSPEVSNTPSDDDSTESTSTTE